MGTVYCGPYADAIGYDDHEGYAARILPDGTETGTWTYETREFRGYRAHCACGWRGTAIHPATDAGEDAALDDWDRDHLRPLIQEEARRHVVTADVLLDVIHQLRTSAYERAPTRSRNAVAASSTPPSWSNTSWPTSHGRRRADDRPSRRAGRGAELLNDVRAALTTYVVLPSPQAADAVTLWIAATHAQPAWAHAPRLVIRGRRSGAGSRACSTSWKRPVIAR